MMKYYRLCWKTPGGKIERGLPVDNLVGGTPERMARYLNIRHPNTHHWVEYLDPATIAKNTENIPKPYDLIAMEVMVRFADAAGLTLDELDKLEEGTLVVDEAIAKKINKGLGDPHISIETLLALQENYGNR